MSLRSLWRKRAETTADVRFMAKHPMPVLRETTHWMVTCWFFEEVGSVVEDEYLDPDGRKACDWANVEETSHGRYLWHARDWKECEDENGQLVPDNITCETCLAMYGDM